MDKAELSIPIATLHQLTSTPFVIPTGAKRSGGICSAPLGLPKFWSSHADSKALTVWSRSHTTKSCPDTKQKLVAELNFDYVLAAAAGVLTVFSFSSEA